VRAREARASDTPAIDRLIGHYAEQGLLLPRAEAEIRGKIANFLVLEKNGNLMSCLALERYGADLAEIRSLAVHPEARGRGVGSKMIDFAFTAARRRGISRVFAVTHAPAFFLRHGFEAVRRESLANKIERDCRSCAKRSFCQLTAVIATVTPVRVTLPLAGDRLTLTPST
jgi:N-acetylglutamate synthase-like GNAT family acetyltransferase